MNIKIDINDLHEQHVEQLEIYKSLNHGSLEYDDNPQLSMFDEDKKKKRTN